MPTLIPSVKRIAVTVFVEVTPRLEPLKTLRAGNPSSCEVKLTKDRLNIVLVDDVLENLELKTPTAPRIGLVLPSFGR